MPGTSTGAAISSSSIGRAMSASSPTAPRFVPQFIENKLKFSPYIGEAVVFGDGRPFVAAIVAIDAATVGNWAERRNLAYTSFQDLASRAEVRVLIGDEIRKCNTGLPEAIRVRRFLVLNKEFDADDDEITRTRKIRRALCRREIRRGRRGVLQRRRRGRGQRRDHLRGRTQGDAALDDRDRRRARRGNAGCGDPHP